MKIGIQSKELTKEDSQILAHITESARKGTPMESKMTVETLATNIEKLSKSDEYHVLTATDEKENLVGWTYYYIAFPLMAFINGYYPVVDDVNDSERITLSLIEASKQDIVELGQHSRLEIETIFYSEAHRAHYNKLVDSYRDCGFKFAAEEIHMKSDLRAIELPEIELPQGYLVKKLSEVSYNQLVQPAFHTLKNSKEGLFLSLNHAEQETTLQYWFDKSKPYIDDASLILQRDGNVVGFVITRPTDDAPEIGPVGLLPEDRGKGLASYLLANVLENLKNSDAESVELDTTVINHTAQKLYRKYGFEDVYYKQFYYWSPS
ncbi:MAG: GNAT family N-acetyltransferase [Candidatus Thorarchaeota archaeon]|nr:GNAT family N-acetyltransferase [Candidatus Thorarchaeota archaeon]